MRRILFVIFVAICLNSFATSGEAVENESGPERKAKIFQSITPFQAMRMLQERDNLLFLDVRTAGERANGAIPGSQLVSLFDLASGKLDLPRDEPVLLVCAVGGRSYVAGQLLSSKGYQEVYNLSGGIKAWYLAGLPLVQDSRPAKQIAGQGS